jgi:hypothetical protein
MAIHSWRCFMKRELWLAGALVAASAASAAADGDVQASVDPATFELRVLGDGADNTIEITSTGTAGGYTITGKNATTVNGQPSFVVSNAAAFLLNMGAGSDRVELTQIRVRSALRVRLGDGSDTVVMQGVRVRARAAFLGSIGDDRVVANECVFRGSFYVRGSHGNDSVEMVNSFVMNRLRADLGGGDDSMAMTNTKLEDFARFEFEGRTGADRLDLIDCTFRNDVDVDMGRHDDELKIEDTNFNEEFDATGGSGGDDDLSLDSDNNFRRVPGFRSFED